MARTSTSAAPGAKESPVRSLEMGTGAPGAQGMPVTADVRVFGAPPVEDAW